MHIKKYGHACLLIDIQGARFITDPGNWNPMPDATGVAALLITHEHQDHMDLEQITHLIKTNPGMRIITHAAVAAKLVEAGIASETIEPGQSVDVQGVSVESVGTEHAVVYGSSPCRNTGFLIGGELFITGDAVHDVPKKVRVLALPTGGPWMKLAEAVDYAKATKPDIVFPVHDAMYIEEYQRGLAPRLIGGLLKGEGIEFVDMPAGASRDF